jgi:hypothetical protein
MDMGLSIKGLLTKLKALESDVEILDWTTMDGQPTKVTLQKIVSDDALKEVTWKIKEWV